MNLTQAAQMVLTFVHVGAVPTRPQLGELQQAMATVRAAGTDPLNRAQLMGHIPGHMGRGRAPVNLKRPCEFCQADTRRRSVALIGGRAFEDTPVCEDCAKCDLCDGVTEVWIASNARGTFAVSVCRCDPAKAADGGRTFVEAV